MALPVPPNISDTFPPVVDSAPIETKATRPMSPPTSTNPAPRLLEAPRLNEFPSNPFFIHSPSFDHDRRPAFCDANGKWGFNHDFSMKN
jgi:hypothetical protein